MPELANARHELFAVLVARGTKIVEAYVKAGYKTQPGRPTEAASSRLLGSVDVAGRVTELKQQFVESVKAALAVTTTDVARHLWQLSYYDVMDVMSLVTTGRGRSRRQRLVLKDTKDWPEAMRRTVQGVRVSQDGSIQLLLPVRQIPGTKVGEHLGMFQGETAGGPTIIDNSQHITYVDAPRHETIEEWQARVAKRLGRKVGA